MPKEPEEGQEAGHENIRRVYALPAEMVERITRFQHEKGLNSEVEAVRRLLDGALKSRDTLETLVNQMLARLGQTKVIADAARDVLAGHPLVTTLHFGEGVVSFKMKDGSGADVSESGRVSIHGKDLEWDYNDTKNFFAGGRLTNGIPF
jgi:hypothetical protein